MVRRTAAERTLVKLDQQLKAAKEDHRLETANVPFFSELNKIRKAALAAIKESDHPQSVVRRVSEEIRGLYPSNGVDRLQRIGDDIAARKGQRQLAATMDELRSAAYVREQKLTFGSAPDSVGSIRQKLGLKGSPLQQLKVEIDTAQDALRIWKKADDHGSDPNVVRNELSVGVAHAFRAVAERLASPKVAEQLVAGSDKAGAATLADLRELATKLEGVGLVRDSFLGKSPTNDVIRSVESLNETLAAHGQEPFAHVSSHPVGEEYFRAWSFSTKAGTGFEYE